jgi:WD repeat-containing protein 26
VPGTAYSLEAASDGDLAQARFRTISTPRGQHRRQRDRSLETGEQVGDHLAPSGPTDSPRIEAEHRRKRRRGNPMMRLEGEGSNSNGSSRPFSNGSGPSSFHKTAITSPTNGARKQTASMNGSSHTNGRSRQVGRPWSTYFGHDREEVTRILIQALSGLGYTSAAGTLSLESGYELESPSVAAFRSAVLQGDWAEAEELLFGSAGPPTEGGVTTTGVGLELAPGADKDVMRFWLRQQKFLELLEERDTGRALMVLRTELTPLYQDVGKLHFLSSLLMCRSTDDLKVKAEWDGAHGQSRNHLLSELSRCISPSVMIPEHRLAVLLQQVKQSQISNCIYHNTESSPSLYSDHRCDRNNFPLRVVIDLDKHSGEVWHLQFSHDGSRLATCGSDGTAIIYDVTSSFEVIHVLADHAMGVCSVSWSPDDTMLVTCSLDRKARLYNASTGGMPVVTLDGFEEPVSTCAWAPDGQTFVTGCLYKERNLCQWKLNGELLYDWGQSHRIQDLAISPDGNRLIAMDNANHLHVYNFVTRELEYQLDLKVNLSSISISQDSKYMLVSTTEGEARTIDIETRESVKIFAGQKAGKFVIRSCFGGANESFVISGSEGTFFDPKVTQTLRVKTLVDGYVFIWHKENGSLVEKLDGHKPKPCNAVSWNPADPCMFATAGDDKIVRM